MLPLPRVVFVCFELVNDCECVIGSTNVAVCEKTTWKQTKKKTTKERKRKREKSLTRKALGI